MLGKIEGKSRRGWQRMKWSGGLIDSMDMSLSKLQEAMQDRGAWRTAVHGVGKSWRWLSDWPTTNWKNLWNTRRGGESFRDSSAWIWGWKRVKSLEGLLHAWLDDGIVSLRSEYEAKSEYEMHKHSHGRVCGSWGIEQTDSSEGLELKRVVRLQHRGWLKPCTGWVRRGSGPAGWASPSWWNGRGSTISDVVTGARTTEDAPDTCFYLEMYFDMYSVLFWASVNPYACHSVTLAILSKVEIWQVSYMRDEAFLKIFCILIIFS